MCVIVYTFDAPLVFEDLQHLRRERLFGEHDANLLALQQLDHVAQFRRRGCQSVRRLDDAGDLEAEFLQQVAIAVVDGHDARDLRFRQLLRRLRLDEPQSPGVLAGVALQGGRVLRTQGARSPSGSRRSVGWRW